MSDAEMIADLYRRHGRDWIMGAVEVLEAAGRRDTITRITDETRVAHGTVTGTVVASVRDSGEYDFDSGADPERPKSRAELLAELAAEGTLQRDLGNGPGITYDNDGNPTMTAVPPIPFDESIYDRDNRAGFNDHRH